MSEIADSSQQTVSFTEMANGTREDYQFLAKHEEEYVKTLPDRLFEALEQLEHSFGGYKVSRLEHSLQSATHAYNAGEDEEMVVAALLHDIGDPLAPHSHSEMAAAILSLCFRKGVLDNQTTRPVSKLLLCPPF